MPPEDAVSPIGNSPDPEQLIATLELILVCLRELRGFAEKGFADALEIDAHLLTEAFVQVGFGIDQALLGKLGGTENAEDLFDGP